MKTRIYLDTSIISALHDQLAPERQRQTRSFWSSLGEFEVSTSELTRGEINRTPDEVRRGQLLGSLAQISMLSLTSEMHTLASRYIEEGIFPRTQSPDALHVAAAVLTRHDVILSWNFKHLVNRRRRALVNAVNLSLRVATVDIISPPEL